MARPIIDQSSPNIFTGAEADSDSLVSCTSQLLLMAMSFSYRA